MKIIVDVIQIIFELALFINAILFIPQAVKIIKDKHARDVSLVTFFGFWLITLFIILHAYITKDYLLLFGNSFTLITCGLVVLLILVYKNN
ncbi:MAG: PQ-loop domain-containing transporter [Gammaproteobacteria bacterium]|jgi:MtN3 and saliva related transmembrane protein